MAADPDSIIQPIVRMQRWLVGATVVLFLILAGAVAYFANEASNSTDALCTLRTDLERRVEDSRVFLEENPDESEALLAAVERSIEGQESTIAALSDLSC